MLQRNRIKYSKRLHVHHKWDKQSKELLRENAVTAVTTTLEKFTLHCSITVNECSAEDHRFQTESCSPSVTPGERQGEALSAPKLTCICK